MCNEVLSMFGLSLDVFKFGAFGNFLKCIFKKRDWKIINFKERNTKNQNLRKWVFKHNYVYKYS